MAADVTLHDGRKLTLDIYCIKGKEYRALVALIGADRGKLVEAEDILVARAWGLSVDAYTDLSPPEMLRLGQEFYKAAREPLADPNSVSASTSG